MGPRLMSMRLISRPAGCAHATNGLVQTSDEETGNVECLTKDTIPPPDDAALVVGSMTSYDTITIVALRSLHLKLCERMETIQAAIPSGLTDLHDTYMKDCNVSGSYPANHSRLHHS